jgi:hypothetical protein
MARITGKDAIKQAVKDFGGSGVDFFTLKEDGQEARVRFLHRDDQDMDVILVHELETDDGKKRYVECTGDGCELCLSGKVDRPRLKLFLSLYDYTDQKLKVWDRGTQMIDMMLGYVEKMGNLDTYDFDIQRHGKKNDTKTQYQLFPHQPGPMIENDKKTVVELPVKPDWYDGRRPDVFGRFVYQWTGDEMKEYLAANSPIDRSKRNAANDRDPKKRF